MVPAGLTRAYVPAAAAAGAASIGAWRAGLVVSGCLRAGWRDRSCPGAIEAWRHADQPFGGRHLATALAAYTSGSAWVNHRDHDTGSIRAGYRADLVVIDPDPFTLAASDLHQARVASTWIDGVCVHARDAATLSSDTSAVPDHLRESS